MEFLEIIFFRGHAFVPSIVSYEIEKFFRFGEIFVPWDKYKNLFIIDSFKSFREYVLNTFDFIIENYGNPRESATHLSFLIYEVAPKYFLGEMNIARNFFVFRVPYWDVDLINLAYKIEYSTITFSKFKNGDIYRENILPAAILFHNKNTRNVPINGILPYIYLKDNKILFWFMKFINKFKAKKHKKKVPLENWPKYFNLILKYFSTEDSFVFVKNYLNSDFIRSVINQKNIYYLNKIITLEILLRLLKNKWSLDF